MSAKLNFLRRPRTTQERRANGKRPSNKKNKKYKIRAKRSLSNIPNAWWDIWVNSTRSWKAYRKTQYKTPGE